MEITAEQARAVADAFFEAGKAIDDYLDANFNEIGRAEYEFLNESFKTLLRVSTFATTMAVGLSIDAMENPATELKNVIDKTKEKIKRLRKVGRIIRVVGGLADLAASIMAKDPKAIASSVLNLNNMIRA